VRDTVGQGGQFVRVGSRLNGSELTCTGQATSEKELARPSKHAVRSSQLILLFLFFVVLRDGWRRQRLAIDGRVNLADRSSLALDIHQSRRRYSHNLLYGFWCFLGDLDLLGLLRPSSLLVLLLGLLEVGTLLELGELTGLLFGGDGWLAKELVPAGLAASNDDYDTERSARDLEIRGTDERTISILIESRHGRSMQAVGLVVLEDLGHGRGSRKELSKTRGSALVRFSIERFRLTSRKSLHSSNEMAPSLFLSTARMNSSSIESLTSTPALLHASRTSAFRNLMSPSTSSSTNTRQSSFSFSSA
jgi:hypothetical protein